MADITDQVTIRGASQDLDRPLSWHTWECVVPASTHVGTNDFVLQLYPDSNTRVIEAMLQVAQPSDVGTSMSVNLRAGTYTNSTGVIGNTGNWVASLDGLDTDTNRSAGGNNISGGFGARATRDASGAQLTEAAIQISFTGVGAAATQDMIVIASVVLGRLDY